MEIARALILAGRRGGDTPPWPAAPTGPRHLFPVANEPIISHNLRALRAAGVLEAAILAGDDERTGIERVIGDGRDWGLSVRYGDWAVADGLHGALTAEEAFVGDEPVLVQRGDALLRDRLQRHIAAFSREGIDALGLRLRPVAACGLRVARGTEATAPGYLFSARAVSMLLERPETADGPLAFVEAGGGRVRVEEVHGVLPCDGDQDALLDSNRAVLEGLAGTTLPVSVEDCVVQGPVEVHPTAQVRGGTLRGPLVIGPGAVVRDSYIGPYSSIGADTVIEGTEIEHSIVLPRAELRFVGTRIESSVIGRGARIVRSFRPPGSLRMSLGDGAEVVIS
jgi:glucose-1-phosphate thymidylyltransferase